MKLPDLSRRGPLGATLAVLLLAFGCSYTSGLHLPEHYRSVGIQVFGNDAYEPDIERSLHAMLSTQVNELVHAPIESPAVSDVVLDGRILTYSRRGGIRGQQNNELLESAVVIQAEGWLTDRLTGDRIGEVARARTRIGYVVQEQQGEYQAQERALRDIAQRLVLDLFSGLD